ncbi:MAG: proline--tRNA ligase [Anaerolineaceae bacterium]|nr:proline--tRNA ligase [Anaerolineaceae bacterium]
MRMSQIFSKTLREAPSEAEFSSHILLIRAGLIRQLGAGIFSMMPLGKRISDKIQQIIREEIEDIGGQEISMPVVNPAEIWKESGRWHQIGSELTRFKDRFDRDLVLAMTHEEVVGSLTRKVIQSYRDLPVLIYHIKTKWRDEARPRAGLIRVREFLMKDSYSLDSTEEGLDKQYRAHYQAYFNIFNRCDLPSIAVRSDSGMMGGNLAHEYMYLSSAGEDVIMMCDSCGYTANRQIAKFKKNSIPAETPREIKKVATPEIKSIEALSTFLDIPESKTAKAVFMMATLIEDDVEIQKLIFAVIRGDMDLNETKLANAVGAKALRPALEEEISLTGAVPGYASPINVKNCMVIVDDSISVSANLAAGANEDGYHLVNVNFPRDFNADMIVDIAVAEEGAGCPECDALLSSSRGIEIGNIFKLGTRYSETFNCMFLDKNGKPRPVIMGSYGIGIGRLMASVAEQHHDDYGLIWPISIAPYHIHLISLKGGEEAAEKLYTDLIDNGLEVLYDDRKENPGVKFNDADLIGIPIRLTVSKRSLEDDSVELKLRMEKEKSKLNLDTVITDVIAIKTSLENNIRSKVTTIPYK